MYIYIYIYIYIGSTPFLFPFISQHCLRSTLRLFFYTLSKSPFQAPFMTRWVLLWKGLLSLATRQVYRWIFRPGVIAGVTSIWPITTTYSNNLMWRVYWLYLLHDHNFLSNLNFCKWNTSIAHDFSSRCSSCNVLVAQRGKKKLVDLHAASLISLYSNTIVILVFLKVMFFLWNFSFKSCHELKQSVAASSENNDSFV